MSKWRLTEFMDESGVDHEAVYILWEDVKEILGHSHTGQSEDDVVLAQHIVNDGGPQWVLEAKEGWADEFGCGLIGPCIAGVA